MIHAIWKFELKPNRVNSLRLPIGARILTAQMQQVPVNGRMTETIRLWCVCSTTDPVEVREFSVLPSGYEGDVPERYIATVQLHGGRGVYHVFNVSKDDNGKS